MEVELKPEKVGHYRLRFYKKDGVVWTQGFENGELMSSFISDTKEEGLRKFKKAFEADMQKERVDR